MFELAKTQFQLAVPLTGGKIHYPESDSVIRGHSPGRVFVDQSTAPQAALVWVQGQSGFFYWGNQGRNSYETWSG